MKTLRYLSAIICAASLMSFSQVAAADGKWLSKREAKSVLKSMNKKDLIPVSMKCRNAPDAGNRLQPEIMIKAKPNTARQLWHVFAHKAQMVWEPSGKSQVGAKTNGGRVSVGSIAKKVKFKSAISSVLQLHPAVQPSIALFGMGQKGVSTVRALGLFKLGHYATDICEGASLFAFKREEGYHAQG